jgi:hypothetical protein
MIFVHVFYIRFGGAGPSFGFHLSRSHYFSDCCTLIYDASIYYTLSLPNILVMRYVTLGSVCVRTQRWQGN